MRVLYGRNFQNCLQIVEGKKLRLLDGWKLKYWGGLGPKRFVWFRGLGLGDDGASGLWRGCSDHKSWGVGLSGWQASGKP